MASLLDMPELAMSKILDELEFRSIVSLQKVSRNVYNFVDILKPDFKLKEIRIAIEPTRIVIFLTTYTEKMPISIMYQDEVFGCSVVVRRRHIVLEDATFYNVFYRDFQQIVNCQKSILKEFCLNAHSIPKEFMSILMSRKLKTKKMRLITCCQCCIFQILSIFSPLTSISVTRHSGIEKWTKNEIVDIWKHGQTFFCIGFQFDLPIEKIAHFNKVDIRMKKVSAEDLVFLKETFFKNPNFDECRLKFDSLENINSIPNLFGPSYFEAVFVKPELRCFFKIPDSNRLLSIVYCNTSVQFSIVFVKN